MDDLVTQLVKAACLAAALVMLIATRRGAEKTYRLEKTPSVNWIAVLVTIGVMGGAVFLAGREVSLPEIGLGVDLPYPALILVGGLLGSAAGFICGAIGGWIETYFFSPWSRLLDARGRSAVAVVGVENGKRSGALLGSINGGLAAALGHIVYLWLYLLVALLFAVLLARIMTRKLSESVEGLTGAIIAGCLAGSAAGYVCLYLLTR